MDVDEIIRKTISDHESNNVNKQKLETPIDENEPNAKKLK